MYFKAILHKSSHQEGSEHFTQSTGSYINNKNI